jgi:hypothetical protein
MTQITKRQIQQLILEAAQELQAELHSSYNKSHEKDDPSDPRVDPPKIKDREGHLRDLLLGSNDEENDEESVQYLEATLDETGEPVCEGCLVVYMNEHYGVLEEATYHGRKVPLGKPMRGDVKKSKVFVRDPKTGNVKKVNFGDPNMRIKKSNPKRRKSFRARHHCENPGPRTKAKFWSCRAWE